MTTKSIALHPHEVRGLLAGTLGQIRRVVNPQPPKLSGPPQYPWFTKDQAMWPVYLNDEKTNHIVKSPYQPGDVVAGKEKWMPFRETNGIRSRIGIKYEADGAKVYDERASKLWTIARNNRWRSARTMPLWASRLSPAIAGVKVQRIQDATEEDAKDEGLTLEECEQVFLKAAGKIKPVPCMWIEDENRRDKFDGADFCPKCARKRVGTADRICGDWIPLESDGPAMCEDCGAPLLMSLTKYGIDRELWLENNDPEDVKRYPAKNGDAAIAAMIAGGIGDLQDKHKGRLAQIGLATLWDSLNPRHPWASNPATWVWTIGRAE
jgi:hypothetical protein